MGWDCFRKGSVWGGVLVEVRKWRVVLLNTSCCDWLTLYQGVSWNAQRVVKS